jgi:hypothetical protein
MSIGCTFVRVYVTKPYQRAGATDFQGILTELDGMLVTKPFWRAGATDCNARF